MSQKPLREPTTEIDNNGFLFSGGKSQPARAATIKGNPSMSDDPKHGLDRRDFMIATVASVSASAALAANTSTAEAQGATTPAVGSAQGAPRGTVSTDDGLHAKKG